MNASPTTSSAIQAAEKEVTLNQADTGYRGVWYMNQPSNDEYKFKYSGGLGTYCAKHQPMAVYCAQVEKTFFCYGGSTQKNHTQLMHMVGCFDHKTGTVTRPTILLDKETDDAHDNPVIAVDGEGYVWIFSTSHGTSRPSYIHKSRTPYDVSAFTRVNPTYRDEKTGEPMPMNNFSYMQVWPEPNKDHGFIAFFTKYHYPVDRTLCFMTSPDGVTWSKWQRIAHMQRGHYQISAVREGMAGSAFNVHPKEGVNWRTNLYYVQTPDFGKSWQTVDGKPLNLPLTDTKSVALVHDFEAEGLKVYMKDICFDAQGHPAILVIVSKGFESGPGNGPRTWMLVRWNGQAWTRTPITTSDSNYDMGSLFLENNARTWRLIAPTETGPQPFNPGGEVAAWISTDDGKTWTREKQLTKDSPRNHTYIRRPVNAHPGFYGFWADGNARAVSESKLYFCTKDGAVYRLPEQMDGPTAQPERVE